MRLEEAGPIRNRKNIRILNGAIGGGSGGDELEEKLEAETVGLDDPLIVNCNREGK